MSDVRKPTKPLLPGPSTRLQPWTNQRCVMAPGLGLSEISVVGWTLTLEGLRAQSIGRVIRQSCLRWSLNDQ